MLSLGVFSTLVFYVALMYIRDPVVLGLFYGLGIATFWPSFNLLLFRLSDTGRRATIISLFSVAIPSITGVVSPAVGGFFIESFGFTSLFACSIILYLVAFIFSLHIRCLPEVQGFSVPKRRVFAVFLMTFVLFGMSESYWIAYPLYVYDVSASVSSMGLVVAACSLINSVIAVAVCRVSDVKRIRVKFAVLGAVLYAFWYLALTVVSDMVGIVVLSTVSGFASAFSLSWYAHYGDTFERKYHASILVMMEVALMAGRLGNLVPTYFFVTAKNYVPYFVFLGIVSLLLIPLFLGSRRRIRQDTSPR